MTSEHLRSSAKASCTSHTAVWRTGLMLTSCSDWLPRADLTPTCEPPQYVVPASWRGTSLFAEAKPSDDELQPDWWKLYSDPVLDKLVGQAIAAIPDLQAAAECFVQAHNMMMKSLAQYLSQVGFVPCVYAIIYDRRMARQKEEVS